MMMICCFIALHVKSQESIKPISMTDIRKDFIFAGTHPCTSEKLYQKLAGYELDDSPVLLAYRGVSRAMMADCVVNPYKKYDYFKSGKNEIERAMKLRPDNLDVHFVRYMAQIRMPAFLGYNNTEEDIAFIMNKLEEQIGKKHDLDFCSKVIEAIIDLPELEKSHKTRLDLLALKLNKSK